MSLIQTLIDKIVSLHTYDRFFGGKWIRCTMVRHCFFHEHSHIVLFSFFVSRMHEYEARKKKKTIEINAMFCFLLLVTFSRNKCSDKNERKKRNHGILFVRLDLQKIVGLFLSVDNICICCI
jgi:hypothetical protein